MGTLDTTVHPFGPVQPTRLPVPARAAATPKPGPLPPEAAPDYDWQDDHSPILEGHPAPRASGGAPVALPLAPDAP